MTLTYNNSNIAVIINSSFQDYSQTTKVYKVIKGSEVKSLGPL